MGGHIAQVAIWRQVAILYGWPYCTGRHTAPGGQVAQAAMFATGGRIATGRGRFAAADTQRQTDLFLTTFRIHF